MQSAVLVPEIVRQHAEEAASLLAIRATLTEAPHAGLNELRRLDERIAAHLDGLSVAGDHAWPFCESALESPFAAGMFTAAVWALQNAPSKLNHVLTFCEADAAAAEGLVGAFEWVECEQLQGVVLEMLRSQSPSRRELGIAACAAHGVDPGGRLADWLRDSDPAVRARALRTAGEVGRQDLIAACVGAIGDPDEECRFRAAWSAVLLGDRHQALDYLRQAAVTMSGHRLPAFRLTLQTLSIGAGHAVLRALVRNPQRLRWVIQGSGLVGDTAYVPWLIAQMRSDPMCRLAGEALSLITGVDLAQPEFSRSSPVTAETGPNDDPEDPDVDIDPDEGLPWPEPDHVERWWKANASRFEPGTRYFMGGPVTREHCIDVMKNGFQRQRILAAHYLSLLNPGAPLFNTSAPARRQERLLARMQ